MNRMEYFRSLVKDEEGIKEISNLIEKMSTHTVIHQMVDDLHSQTLGIPREYSWLTDTLGEALDKLEKQWDEWIEEEIEDEN